MLIPDRDPSAQEGTTFCKSLPPQLTRAREDALLAELSSGNVPEFLRSFVYVEMGDDTGSTAHSIKLRVSPDYLSVGSDSDHVRVPLAPATAQVLCDQWGCMLPTKRMVDGIWRVSTIRLQQKTMPPTNQMTSVKWFVDHSFIVDKQLLLEPTFQLGALVAGHKKDVVITAKVFKTDRVAIYGWQGKTGLAIQGPNPNQTSHDRHYADYSHGIRLIDQMCLFDGQERPVAEILADPLLCTYLSHEGVVLEPRYKV